jgi:hypothetical protein
MNEASPAKKPRAIAIQFLSGAGLAMLLLFVPISYMLFFTPDIGISALHIGLAVGFTLLCGTLSAFWGNQVLEALSKLLESLPV